MKKILFSFKYTFIDHIKTFIIAIMGGLLFTILQFPLSFLLGPLTIIVLLRFLFGISFIWSKHLRDAGLIVIGYILGISFTKQTLLLLIDQIGFVLFATIMTILFSLIGAYFIVKRTDISIESALLGCMPGGLSQMVILAEEYKNANLTSVTILQVIRVMAVIFLVPFIVSSDSFMPSVPAKTENIHHLYIYQSPWNILLYGIVIALFLFIALRFKLATPYLLGPMLAGILLSVSGFLPPSIPNTILSASQLMIGAHLGLMLNPETLKQSKRLTVYATLFGSLLVFFTLFLGKLLTLFSHFTLATAFLSTAPGGMAEMGITAIAIGADSAIVAAYQLFRLLFILIVVPPFLRYIIKKTT